MTLQAYDELCDRIASNEYKCGGWWPRVEDLEKYVVPDPEKYMEFLIWICETASPPYDESDKASQNMINKILTKLIKFKDDKNNYNERR